MPQVSSLHLGSVSTSSRGLFPPPLHSALVRAAPRRYWALCCVDPSWFIIMLDQPPSWRLKSRVPHTEICHPHFLFFSLSSFLSIPVFGSSPSPLTPLCTPGQTMLPFSCHALQQFWSACQETVSHFQDRTTPPWKYPKYTHNVSGKPAGRQVDTLVHGRTGR